MARLQESHIFSGMQRDSSPSKHPAQFVYDAWNVRFTAREGDTMMSITNEKGTLTTNQSISGNYVGHCLLNKYLVVFSEAPNKSFITRFDLSTNPITKDLLYGGSESHTSLGFSTDHPIDAIVSFESEDIQKIYWTDGQNQPRMINIAPDNDSKIGSYTSISFDFIPELALEERVSVTKLFGASGEFPPGMIQYAFTYYDKYGHETNIFYTTKLYAVAYRDRGASPEDKVDVAFRIVINDVDRNFDYLRIYSVERTSINATPICKRVQDIKVSEMNYDSEDDEYWTVYIDTGVNGETIDLTELLYKGGESILAQTIEQKDNTLFLGNLKIKREPIPSGVKSRFQTLLSPKTVSIDSDSIGAVAMSSTSKTFQGQVITTGDIPYVNTIDHSGLKNREVYRFGIQFQHISGKWSEPVWLRDYKIKQAPSITESSGSLSLPQVRVTIADETIRSGLVAANYKKARLMMAQTGNTDRTILCQGIANPTVYTNIQRHQIDENGDIDATSKGSLYAQASWIFRPYWYDEFPNNSTAIDGAGYIPAVGDIFDYFSGGINGNHGSASPRLRSIEIGCVLDDNNEFRIDPTLVTIHTPELIFNETSFAENWNTSGLRHVGNTSFATTFGDIDIQTKTPTIGSAKGFVHKFIKTDGNAALVSGLFYEDYVVEDYNGTDTKYRRYKGEHIPVKWPVFMWHHTGSLNNDVNREARSAELLKKRISNYHVSDSYVPANTPIVKTVQGMQLFQNDEVSVIKINGNNYMGNIDTSIVPKEPMPKYFVCDSPFSAIDTTTFISNVWWKLALQTPGDANTRNGFWELIFQDSIGAWRNPGGTWSAIGGEITDLCETSEPIRMKYKSTPHLVAQLALPSLFDDINDACLPLVEVTKSYNRDTFFGGQSDDALKANVWLPISDPVTIPSNGGFTIISDRGDTWYQRFDCLKTYAFTPEDINQVIDIASFMVETHCNIDGRYDRNRGQSSNLNMSPRNYNLYNPVYSQADNFFNYRILDSDYYENNNFPNQITWTKEKQSGADIDLWTNITLASTYDMDGSKGEVISLNTWKNQIYCFQNKGVSNILFNSRVQIPVSDGVPIEISNNYKVDGYNYISDGIGCNDKWLIKETPAGIYFVDSVGNHLFHIADGLTDLAEQCNVTTLFRDFGDDIKRVVYDDINHDVYVVLDDRALCFSEKLNQFTGFYGYGHINLIETYDHHVFTIKNGNLWKMFEGQYCNLFGYNEPWDLTFISNGISNNAALLDKTFTNLEFRASVEGDGTLDSETQKFTPTTPFDSLETWNEYQHGIANLGIRNGHTAFQHHGDQGVASLKRKFRIWRCDIPRNNAALNTDSGLPNCFRKIRKPIDRMRNPWLYVKLQKRAAGEDEHLERTEIHDLVMTYFN